MNRIFFMGRTTKTLSAATARSRMKSRFEDLLNSLILLLIILRNIPNMEAKFSLKWVRFFTRCLPIAFTLNDVGQNVHVSRHENLFLLNCRLLVAADYDWNSDISQNVQNLGRFWKKYGFFLKRNVDLFKVPKLGKHFVQCVLDGIIP